MDEASVIWGALRCGVSDWVQFMGDPLLSGTIFMVSYGATAWLILAVARRAQSRERLYWRICGGLFVFQVVNVHLDLHGLVWTSGRCLAHAQGWYANRREVQALFLAAVFMSVALILLAALIVFLRQILASALLTLGVSIAVGFTIIKGINYHDLEGYYGGQVGPFRVADYIEWSGILLAFLAAVTRLRRIGTRSEDRVPIRA